MTQKTLKVRNGPTRPEPWDGGGTPPSLFASESAGGTDFVCGTCGSIVIEQIDDVEDLMGMEFECDACGSELVLET